MKKNNRIILLLLMLLPVMLLLAGCSNNVQQEETVYKNLSQLEDKRIGAVTGTVQSIQVEKRFPDAKISYFESSTDMLNALRTGKIDAFADSKEIIKYMMADNADLTYLDEEISEGMKAGAVFSKTEKGKALCDEYSDYILKIKENGVYDDIYSTWISMDKSGQKALYPESLEAKNGTIRAAFDNTLPPMVFSIDDGYGGIDADILMHFCEEKGYGLQAYSMPFSSVLAAVTSGKADMACGGVSYTEERAKSVSFSEFTFEDKSALAVLRPKSETLSITLEDMKKPGFRVAYVTGSALYDSAIKLFPDAEYFQYDSFVDEFNALSTGKVDGALAFGTQMAAADEIPSIAYTPLPVDNYDFGFAMRKDDEGDKLKKEMDAYIKKLIKSGKMDELREKWDKSGGEQCMDEYTFSGKNFPRKQVCGIIMN